MTANITPNAAMTNAPIAIVNFHAFDIHAPIYDPDIEQHPTVLPPSPARSSCHPSLEPPPHPTIRSEASAVNHHSTGRRRHPSFAPRTDSENSPGRLRLAGRGGGGAPLLQRQPGVTVQHLVHGGREAAL